MLRRAEEHGWRVEKGSKYFKLYCPCADMHKKTVKLTPSGGDYHKNLLSWFNRQGCWKKAGR